MALIKTTSKVIRYSYVLIFGLIAFNSCTQPKITSEAQFIKWLNEPKNGLLQSKEVNDLRLTVKFLPATFLAYKESKSLPALNKQIMDSLIKSYSNSYTFLLTIEPDLDQKGDVMLKGLKSYQDYKNRVLEMNFEMNDQISLQVGEQKLRPVLHAFENTYSLIDQRSILFVFTLGELDENALENKKIDFTYTDQVFDTGITHFVFNRSDLENIPALSLFTN